MIYKIKRGLQVPVSFYISNEEAEYAYTVALSGTFNDWNTSVFFMKKTATGFETTLDLQIKKKYEFKYILNG